MAPSNEETDQKLLWKYSHLLNACFGKKKFPEKEKQIIFWAKLTLNFFLIRRLVFREFTINMHASILVI